MRYTYKVAQLFLLLFLHIKIVLKYAGWCDVFIY